MELYFTTKACIEVKQYSSFHSYHLEHAKLFTDTD